MRAWSEGASQRLERFGFDPLLRFYLAFAEEVWQAGSREDPLDRRGCPCRTPAPSCPPPELLNLVGVRADENAITLAARTSSRVARCPVCGKRDPAGSTPATRGHWRTCPGRVPRLRCPCPSEGSSATRPPAGERSSRSVCLVSPHITLGVHSGWRAGSRTSPSPSEGEAGSRLLKDLGVVVSGDTLLNHIRSLRLEDRGTPRVLSVDDFAFRRGTRYGTVLVDLERHALVDLLPDRSAGSFARWLIEHPGVEVVSWDRGGEYAEATRRAAPDAVQVADRFHLLKTLRDVVSRVFGQYAEVLDLVPPPTNHLQRLTNLRLDREASKDRTREQGGSSSGPFTPFLRKA